MCCVFWTRTWTMSFLINIVARKVYHSGFLFPHWLNVWLIEDSKIHSIPLFSTNKKSRFMNWNILKVKIILALRNHPTHGGVRGRKTFMTLIALLPLVPDQVFMPHMKALYVPFHLGTYGRLQCYQSHKRLSVIGLIETIRDLPY